MQWRHKGTGNQERSGSKCYNKWSGWKNTENRGRGIKIMKKKKTLKKQQQDGNVVLISDVKERIRKRRTKQEKYILNKWLKN